LQAAGKLIRAVGRGFIPGKKPIESAWALQAAEKLGPLPIFDRLVSGHGFSRAAMKQKNRGL